MEGEIRRAKSHNGERTDEKPSDASRDRATTMLRRLDAFADPALSLRSGDSRARGTEMQHSSRAPSARGLVFLSHGVAHRVTHTRARARARCHRGRPPLSFVSRRRESARTRSLRAVGRERSRSSERGRAGSRRRRAEPVPLARASSQASLGGSEPY